MDSPVSAGRPFVLSGQKFISILGTQKAWQYYGAICLLMLLGIIALLIVQNLTLQSLLLQRKVIIVGQTTAKQLVPLWPDGVGSSTCDTLCIEGSLETWITSFRFISGEMNTDQPSQHEAQERAASMIAKDSAAAEIVAQYYTHYSPYVIASHGERLDVINVHVDADHITAGRFLAHWTDIVTNVRTHGIIGRHNFSASIDAHSDPNARTEDQIRYNPGGVVITDIHQFGDQ